MKITSVNKKSLGHRAGLRPDHDLVSINGKKINDSLDLRFYESDELLDVISRDRAGRKHRSVIEKEYDDSLGVILEEPKFHSCGNKCIFCFVDQMPRGMRRALYFKDEDFRLSFLYGNYITLSNISRADLARIKQQRLSPLYISVHTTDPGLRKMMLGGRREADILGPLAELTAAGVELHTQIVLCPGINDGRHLKKTVSDLLELYPGIKSIAVVPVGLTRYRQKLYPLKAIDRQYSRQLIEGYRGWQAKLRQKFKKTILYFADEFYLNAGLDFPASFWYDDYPQLDNGVGMVREFWRRFQMLSRNLREGVGRPRTVLLITGISGTRVLKPVASRLNRVKNLDCRIHPVTNGLFGDTVTVSGLLAGREILSSLKGRPVDLVALPDNLLNHHGYFIDDLSLAEFRRRLAPAQVVVGLEQLIENI